MRLDGKDWGSEDKEKSYFELVYFLFFIFSIFFFVGGEDLAFVVLEYDVDMIGPSDVLCTNNL